MERVRDLIREVPDFPEKGVLFRDITPVLQDPSAFGRITDNFAERYRGRGITKVLGIESRGFIFGAAVAQRMECGLVLVRKPGKLPRPTFTMAYELEYGQDTLEVHQDALAAGDRVVVVDDVIATGGTARAAADLALRCGAAVEEVGVVIEIAALEGRQRLTPHALHALLTY